MRPLALASSVVSTLLFGSTAFASSLIAQAESPSDDPSWDKEFNNPAADDATDGDQQEGKIVATTFNIGAVVGLLMPEGSLKDRAKSSAVYGAAVGLSLLDLPAGAVRLTLGASGAKLSARSEDWTGSVNIQIYQLRADYLFGSGWVQPFVGIGLGLFHSDGAITSTASGRQNHDSHSDSGSLVAVGCDFTVYDQLTIAPEIAYYSVEGELASRLLSAGVAVRWSY